MNIYLQNKCSIGKFSNLLMVLFFVFFSFNPTVNAQVVGVGTTTSRTVLDYAASESFSHTVPAGNRRLLIVGVTQNRNTGNGVTGVTYGGTAMILVGRRQYDGNKDDRGWVHIYRLVNPTVGTANVVITFGEPDNRGFTAGATNFTNVNQSTPTNTFAFTEDKNVFTATLSNIPSATNQLVYSILSSRDRNITGFGLGQTALWNLNSNASANDRNTGAGSVKTSAGNNQSVSYTRNNENREWVIGAVSIIPDPFSASGVVTDAGCPSGVNGAINITVNGGVGPFTYLWSNGATTQNISGLSANTYSVTVTGSNNATTTSSFVVGGPSSLLDTDGDGVINVCDLDDDNDGILDTDECAAAGPTAQATINTTGGSSQSITLNGSIAGFVVELTRLDNSFNLQINGTPITNNELNFTSNSSFAPLTVQFADGTRYGANGIPQIWAMGTANAATPLLRLVYEQNGTLTITGSKTLNGPMEPMVLVNSTTVNAITFNPTTNTAVVGQIVDGPTYANGRIFNLNSFCGGDTDGDGITDNLDADSDNDGCPDAVEGSATNITAANLDSNGRITGGVNANGIPTLAATSATTGQATNAAVITAERITVTTAPVNQNISVGNNVTFSVTAAGVRTTTWATTAPFAPNYSVPPGTNSTSTLTYKWYKNTAPATTLSTTSSLAVNNVQNTSAGDYTVEISGPNKAGCPESRTARLSVINPVTDSGSAAATGGTAVANVRSNDFVNGVAATSANSTIAQSGTWPSGVTLNTTTGAIAVANGTAPGVYSLVYRLCDLTTPTANCNTVTNTITVTAVINPVTDSGSAAATGGTAVANVRSNDFVNGIAATSANSTIAQSGTWPSGVTLNTTTGAIAVANGTAPGVYSVAYQLCDLATPTPNCNTVTNSITVNPVINPVTDSGSAAATGGTAVTNVRSNDFVNGIAATNSNSAITQSGTWPTGITLNTSTGAIAVANGTTPGVYAVVYQLCDLASTPNCNTVTDNITVTPVINPVTDSGTAAATGGTAVTNVRSNDFVNGIAATSANSTITQSGTWPTGITLNTSTGAIAVANGTIPGIYAVTYQLCDLASTPNCNTVTDNITVTPVINPVTENGTSPATGGTAVTNVRSNDFVNGIAATNSNSAITQSGTWPTGITLNTTTGAIAVANGTIPGIYAVTYQLCDLASTPNCNTVTDNITVTAVINPVTESGTVPFTGGTAVANVRSNDFVNGIAATSANSAITQSGTWPIGITLNSTTGEISVANGTVIPGVYLISYQLCDLASPTANCATVENSITVNPRIQPNPDVNVGLVNQQIDGNVGTNDIVPVGTTYGTAVAVGTNPNATIPTVNSNGTYTFITAVPGVYIFNVPVCVVGEPLPCPNQPLVITVLNPNVNTNGPVANTDLATTSINTAVNVAILGNDNAGNAGGILSTPTVVSVGNPNSTAIINANGELEYTPETGFIGQDIVTYQVCETPSGLCTTAKVFITVNVAGAVNSTLAVDDYVSTIGTATVTGNVKNNDIDPEGDVQTVTAQGSEASPITIPGKGTYFVNTDGTYSFIAAAGFNGSVAIAYTTCDDGTPPACASGTIYVLVKAICTKLPNTSAATSITVTGFSAHTSIQATWPGVIPNGVVALESSTKGFVITRITTAARDAASFVPVEGMLIYNTTVNRFQLRKANIWVNLKRGCIN